MKYPAILDRTDLPAVFRSVRCPRPNYALFGKPKRPVPDLLLRLVELAGEHVATRIANEFGGRVVSIRSEVYLHGRVYCRDCRHLQFDSAKYGYQPDSHCALSGRWVSHSHPRKCREFLALPIRESRTGF